MCTRVIKGLAGIASLILIASACGGSQHTSSSFCAQLGKEIPFIGQRVTTKTQATEMVDRYKRLLRRAPLTIEGDLAIVTDVLVMASKVNPQNEDQVQELANASYASKQSADNVREWVMSTCAVDISTGLTIAPPRVATTTVAPTSTTTPSSKATTQPTATTSSAPATPSSQP